MVEGARLLSECAANNRTAGSNPALSVPLSSSASSPFAKSNSLEAALSKVEMDEHFLSDDFLIALSAPDSKT